jgi:biopolymer transport protein ExbD
MGDIAFLLLIFFMATTIFKTEEGIEVRLPRSETGENQKKEDVLHVWIDQRRVDQ